jgi:tRNA pseudouridine38-40 synthase
MEEPALLAIAIGYLGEDFHGSQYQPKIETVQGTLEQIAYELTWGEKPRERVHSLKLASRTDAGVNVRKNIAVLELPRHIWNGVGQRKMVQAFNDRLPATLWVWGVCEVPVGFEPRFPLNRTYRYRLEGLANWPGSSIEQMEKWLTIFVGENDFSNFCNPRAISDRNRTIYSAKPWINNGQVIGFEITGYSFIWNQVRRIAHAILCLARGDVAISEVEDALYKPEIPCDLGMAEPDWLVLWGMEHEELSYQEPEADLSHFSNSPEWLTFRQRQHWCRVAKAEVRSWMLQDGLSLRLANYKKE